MSLGINFKWSNRPDLHGQVNPHWKCGVFLFHSRLHEIKPIVRIALTVCNTKLQISWSRYCPKLALNIGTGYRTCTDMSLGQIILSYSGILIPPIQH